MKIFIFDDDEQSPFSVDYIHCFMKLGPPRFMNTTTTESTTTTMTTTTSTGSNPAYILDGHNPIEGLWAVNNLGVFELQTAITFDCPIKFSSAFNHQDNIIIISNYCSFIYFFDSDCGLSETSIPSPFPRKDNDDQMTSHTISDDRYIFAHYNGEIKSLKITDFPASSQSWVAHTPIGPVLESRGKKLHSITFYFVF